MLSPWVRTQFLVIEICIEKYNLTILYFHERICVGSALSLGANVFLAFEQLGILEEFYSKAKPFAQTRAYGEGHNKIRIRDYSPANEM